MCRIACSRCRRRRTFIAVRISRAGLRRQLGRRKNRRKTPENLRGLAVAPNGDAYCKGHYGQIFALRDTNSDGRADVIEQFGPGDGGMRIMFHDGYLYHSSRTTVFRYKYIPGELVPSSPLEVIVHDLPATRDHDQNAFALSTVVND